HFGNTGLDIAFDVANTSDLQYILTGITAEQGSEVQEALLIKLGLNGDTVWSHVFGGIRKSFGFSVRQTADEGYVICGSTDASGTGIYDVYVVKPDPDGILTPIPDGLAGNPSLQVFPNPSDGRFTVKLPPGTRQLIVSDQSGKVVANVDAFSGEIYNLDLTGYIRGLYLVKVITTHIKLLEKLIIQ
ncbi:MAG: T9SS type A sorting domain-containing protein, partial [bacterium]